MKREGEPAEPDAGNPAFDRAPLSHGRPSLPSSRRASAHSACSRSIGSSDWAYPSTTLRVLESEPPFAASAMSAFRRR